jgi:hypothetical protein
MQAGSAGRCASFSAAYLEQRIDTTMTATLLMKAEQAVPDRWVKS